MRYHIWTVGCQMNKADSLKLAAGLDRLGWVEVAKPHDADLVVLNTCSVRGHAEQRAVSKLGTLKKMRAGGSGLKIAVMGCMVGPKTDDLRRRFPFVDVFARPQQFGPVLEAVGYDDLGGEFWPETFARADGVTAYVPVIHGCDKFCTFCIVPYRRGRERSRSIEEIRAEVEHLAARGVRELTLLGQTVEAYGHDLPPVMAPVYSGREMPEDRGWRGFASPRTESPRLPDTQTMPPTSVGGAVESPPTVEAYGHDLPDGQTMPPTSVGGVLPSSTDTAGAIPEAGSGRPPDLADLLRALHDIKGIHRLRFLTSHPKDMTERIVDAVAELPKVCEYFNIPVQSGDDAVLARMRRGYDVALFREKVELIRRRMPDAAITTDVIVGFCGETEEQFRRTYDLLAELQFDKVHVAAYSPRPGTIAHRELPDDVPQEVKMMRLHAVEQLEAEISGRINARLVGQDVEVLVEGQKPFGQQLRAEPGPDGDLAPYGRTRSDKLVHFRGDVEPGNLVRVRIERASPWSLAGTVRERVTELA